MCKRAVLLFMPVPIHARFFCLQGKGIGENGTLCVFLSVLRLLFGSFLVRADDMGRSRRHFSSWFNVSLSQLELATGLAATCPPLRPPPLLVRADSLLQTMNKLIDTSKSLLQEVQTLPPATVGSTATSAETPTLSSIETSPAAPAAPSVASSNSSSTASNGGSSGSGTEGKGGAGDNGAVSMLPPKDILSGIKGVLKMGSVEPASAAETEQGGGASGGTTVDGIVSGNNTIGVGSADGSGEGDGDGGSGRGEGDAVAVAAANLLNLLDGKNSSGNALPSSLSASSSSSSYPEEENLGNASLLSASSSSAENEGGNTGGDGDVGEGGGRGSGGRQNTVRRMHRRWKEGVPPSPPDAGGIGSGSSSSEKRKESLRALAAGDGDPVRGLTDTFAWVQQVAGEKVREVG